MPRSDKNRKTVVGHRVVLSQRSRNRVDISCTCGWAHTVGHKRAAGGPVTSHLDEAVALGAEVQMVQERGWSGRHRPLRVDDE